MCLSVDIFVSVFFSESEYAFSFCVFESLFQEVIFYITFGVFNLITQIVHLLGLHCQYSISSTAFVAS